MKKNIIQVSMLTVSIAWLLLGCGGGEVKEEKVLRPVVYQEVGFESGDDARTFNGVAQSNQIINLSFRNSGIITAFNMKLGQRVRKGDLLAKLDNVQVRLAYEQSLSSLRSAESQMKTAKLSYERTRALYEKGSAALSDFENAKNAFRNAESGFASAQRSVEIQKEQINYGFIYAPASGVISSVSAEVGENASPGQPVAVLNAGSQIVIELGLPENVINKVKAGMKVNIEFSSISETSFEGQVTEVSPALDPASSTYQTKVQIIKPSKDVKSGMAASVTFQFQETAVSESLTVPVRAVGEDSNGRFVFLIKEGTNGIATVEKKQITIGQLRNDNFEVKEGLEKGQKIAVAGLQTLLDGQEVKLQK